MKSALVIATISIAATAYAEDSQPQPQADARPVVHVVERAPVYAEPAGTSRVLLFVLPSDDLYAGIKHGDWTYVELATGSGWIATTRLQPPGAPAVAVTVAPQQQADQADDEPTPRPVGKRFVNGFRLGWMYIANIDKMRGDGMTLRERTGLKSPHMFVLGYELMFRAISHSFVNAIVVGNASIAGIDQSKFIPSLNGLVGVELDRNFQAAVGVTMTPDPYAPTHVILAAGWTPAVGSIQWPVHFIYIPDTEGNYRVGATVGMNW